jgi:hypothetical protein
MIGTIKLTRFLSQPESEDIFPRHNWPLVIHATSTGNMPSAVFVFQKLTSALDPLQYDQFTNVASAHDIFEIPKQPTSSVDDEMDSPFYRASQVRLFLRSPEEVDEIWGKIKADVIGLTRNLEAENRLKAVDITEITPLDTTPITVHETVDTLDQTDQVLLTLDYRPAGIPDVDGSDNQTILTPDANLTGWLPVSEAPGGWSVPTDAKFFYNTAQDSTVATELPFLQPGNVHLLYINGSKLTHGSSYKITSEGIFWLSFTPVDTTDSLTILDGQILLSQNITGNAPWPIDYVDRGSPGTSIPDYELLLFRT